jgi:hypothetical protein
MQSRRRRRETAVPDDGHERPDLIQFHEASVLLIEVP